MKLISWQLTIIILVVVLCVTTLELYALSQEINGTGLAVAVGLIVALPSSIILMKAQKKNGKVK